MAWPGQAEKSRDKGRDIREQAERIVTAQGQSEKSRDRQEHSWAGRAYSAWQTKNQRHAGTCFGRQGADSFLAIGQRSRIRKSKYNVRNGESCI
jgi:hypothetical protein